MAKKTFVAFLVLAMMIFAGGILPAAPDAAPAPPPQQPAPEKTTVAKVSSIIFLEIYPRSTGEDEFYIVMNQEDLGRAKAVVDALTQAQIPATMVSGNLIKVAIPGQWRLFGAFLAARINDAEVTLPAPNPGVPATTESLIDALKSGPDDQVRLNAAITLGQRKELAAYAALAKIAKEEKGWVRRGALYAMSFFQQQNAQEMQQWRAEFLNAAANAINILQEIEKAQGKPLGDAELQKKITDLKAAFNDVLDYYLLFNSNAGEASELANSVKVLEEIIATANRLYPEADKASIKKLVAAAEKGIGDYLDPFSVVWDKEAFVKFTEATSATFVGIGVYIEKDEKGFVIVSPIFGSPAYGAGLQPRDRILKVNGEEIKDLDTEALKAKITGEPGTIVKISIMREGWDTPHDFDIKREKIQLPVVLSAMLPGDVGYLRLLQFSQDAPVAFQKALDELNKQAPLKGLIIDLRNNPGGTVPATVAIASMFLPKATPDGKPVLVTQFKGRPEVPSANEVWNADIVTPRQADYPIVMLVNGASASGAELLTGALHDHGRATVIGQKTFGKGCGQHIFPMLTSKGETYFKITVFKYYLPNGECIHELGIKPDVPLPLVELEKWQIDEITTKITPKTLKDYIEKYYQANKELLDKLAIDDAKDPGKYPGFDEFYTSLDTKLDKDIVRRVLRNRVRDEIAALTSKPFSYDLSEDKELQCAVYELFQKMGKNAADLPEYKGFADSAKAQIEAALKQKAEDDAKEAAAKAEAEKNKPADSETPNPAPAPAPIPAPAPAPAPEPAPANP